MRAMYLFSGVADLVAETGDRSYIDAMERIWQDIVKRKMYITGGIGVSGHGEGFSAGYDLPNEEAYAETCASIALAFFSHRLNRLYADARYADIFERVLYNGLLSGVSLDGDKFFYINPLASRGVEHFETSGGKEGESKQHRQHWFRCACCPSNVVRFMPTVGGYIYAKSDDAIYVNLYIDSRTEISINEAKVNLHQKTRYPWDEDIRIEVEPETETEFNINIRIPGWCDDYRLRLNGRPVNYALEKGYAVISREWKNGDTIDLKLPMEIKRMEANPRVENNRGKIALQRGPLVYCLEEVDNSEDVWFMAIPRDAKLKAKHRRNLLGGVTVIEGDALVQREYHDFDSLYRPLPEAETVSFTAIPYYAWDNREPGMMKVWIPQDPTLAPRKTLLNTSEISSSHVNSKDSFIALYDGEIPESSHDKSIRRFTWWDHKGTKEWVQYEFPKPSSVTGVEVYWFDDENSEGKCRVPESWKLLVKDNGSWKPVQGASNYHTELDQFNKVTFPAVKTSGLRIKVQLQSDFSGGILEWRVLR